jgi:flagellar protein FliS
MASNAHDVYLESRVLSADAVELVQILYQGAIESVEKARQHLKEGDIAARTRQINRCCAILGELAASLDQEAGGDLSRTLLELYDYMVRRLVEANFQQTDPPLVEVSRLLATILDGWMKCRTPGRPAAEHAYEQHETQPSVAVSY